MRALSPTFSIDIPPVRRVKLPLPKRKRDAAAASHSQPPSLSDDNDTAPKALSAHMALQAYYTPILSTKNPLDLRTGRGTDEEIGGDGDYIDHLQQPGNTKKRKVPANMSGSRQPDGPVSPDSEPLGGVHADQGDMVDTFPPSAPAGVAAVPTMYQRRGRISAATLAGLQHKEMLKSRKKQLAAVLGALTHGDTLAIDQALSARYPVGFSGDSNEPARIRLSMRRGPRLARAAKARWTSQVDARSTFPSREFTVVFPSTTSQRLVATRKEVAVLHSRVEAELAHQAAKAAEIAKQSAVSNTQNVRRPGSKLDVPSAKPPPPAVDPLGLDLQVLGLKRGKKKKRSALANASNPHHLRNYVPSRLPNSGPTNTTQVNVNAQNHLGPPPIRFLSARIPPRQSKENVTVAPTSLTNPEDEWICPFCEYKLFYGEDSGYTKSVRNRKKILKRRRRAQERAAAAASGKPLSAPLDRADPIYDDGNREAEFEGPYAKNAVPGAAHKPPRWKTDADGSGVEPYTHPLG